MPLRSGEGRGPRRPSFPVRKESGGTFRAGRSRCFPRDGRHARRFAFYPPHGRLLHRIFPIGGRTIRFGKIKFGPFFAARDTDREPPAKIAFNVGGFVALARDAPSVYAEQCEIASLALAASR